MGDPKTPRRIWKKPKRPLNYDLLMDELKTIGTFGLKTKRELWKARTELSRVRHQARSLLALGQDMREREEPILMNSLSKIGLVDKNSTLDNVLNLQVSDLLSRRLQTFVHKILYFKTPYQARQAVVHGHVMVGDRVVTIPSYKVKVEEESSIHLTPESSLIKHYPNQNQIWEALKQKTWMLKLMYNQKMKMYQLSKKHRKRQLYNHKLSLSTDKNLIS